MTLTEILMILASSYTPEELCDLLKLDSHTMVYTFTDVIEERFEEIAKQVEEDTGWES